MSLHSSVFIWNNNKHVIKIKIKTLPTREQETDANKISGNYPVALPTTPLEATTTTARQNQTEPKSKYLKPWGPGGVSNLW